MPNLTGLCHICGKTTTRTCRMCGRPTCEKHLEGGVCTTCREGKKI